MRKTCSPLVKFTFVVVGLAVISLVSTSTCAQTITTAPNPCGNGYIPVWTTPGQYFCYTLTQYNAQLPGTLNIACPNGGAYNATLGAWECNNGPSPAFTQQYLNCLNVLGPTGVCDPAGLGTSLVANFLPGTSELAQIAAAVELVNNRNAGWSTVCGVWAVTEPGSLQDWEQLIMDASCTLLGLLGGNLTPPAIQLFTPQIHALQVEINGVTLPTTPGATITGIVWNWGDGALTTSWFPASHTYARSGTYSLTATATDSNGLTQSAPTSVTVSSQGQTPPTIQLFAPQVNGLEVEINGVTLPTTPGATITGIAWNWGDGTLTTSWFPSSHTYAGSGTYSLTATATDSNGLTQSATTSVTVGGS